MEKERSFAYSERDLFISHCDPNRRRRVSNTRDCCLHTPALFSTSLTRRAACWVYGCVQAQLRDAARLDGRNLMPLLCNADIYFVFPAAEKKVKERIFLYGRV